MRSPREVGQSIQNAIAMTPALAPPPPLSRSSSTWRYFVAGLLSVVVWSSVTADQWDFRRWLIVVDPLLGVMTFGLMHYRRRWPLAVAVIANLATAISATAVGPACVVTVSLATRRRIREIALIFALAPVTSWAYYSVQPNQTDGFVQFLLGLVIVGALVAVGMYVGARRELIANLKERAERAEREQSLHVEQAQASERARIAREMHDVLAHRISRIAMHAGALAYRTDLDPTTAREAAEVIQADAHGALTELRSVLGVLRMTNGAGEPERPQPTLAELDTLVAGALAGGMNVTYEPTSPEIAHLPDHVGRTAYRIVQEGLTNAGKHAPGTWVHVRVERAGEELTVEVRNRLPIRASIAPPGSGFGLIGLTERTVLAGGELEHGVTDGDFLVRARLPL